MSNEAPPPSARMMQLVSGQWVAQAVYVAAKLGVADRLADGPRPVAEIARAVGAHEDALARLMRMLAAFGVFEARGEGVYALTPMGDTLRTGAPGSCREMAVMLGEEFHWRALGSLLHSVRTSEPAFDHVFGAHAFDYFTKDREAGEIFDAAMTSFTAQNAPLVPEFHDFRGIRTLVDVGGGHGLLLRTVLEANPDLKGILYELPAVARGARLALASSPVAARCEVVEGSFLESVPPAHAYMMKHIIHDWSDAHCLKLLGHCRKGIAPDGRLLILELVVPPGPELHFSKILDLEMLVMTTGGRERTEPEFASLLSRTGFTLHAITPLPSGLSIIEARPA